MTRLEYTVSLLLFLLLVPVVNSYVDDDGKFCIFILVPFTHNGNELPFEYNAKNKTNVDTINYNGDQIGYTYMAAALLAVKHFNERDPSVVPELSGEFYQNHCTFQIDLSSGGGDDENDNDNTNRKSTRVIDSQLMGQTAGKKVVDYIKETGEGCPMVGPYADDVAKALSSIAGSVEVPIVLYHAMGYELSNKALYPYTSQTNALSLDLLYPLSQYLIYTGRNNYISVLYEVEGRAVSSLHEALLRILRSYGMFANREGFINSNLPDGLESILYDDNTIYAALRRFKVQGNFRTIVVLLDPVNINQTLPQLARAAEDLGMNTGQHVWIFFGTPVYSLVSTRDVQQNELILKLLQGAAVIDYVDGFSVDGDQDPFLQSWRGQNNTMVRLVNQMNPIKAGEAGYYFAEDDYFQSHTPVHGASYVYDSVMATGIGACLAGLITKNTTMTGIAHSMGIDSVSFRGATGDVSFGFSTGTRNVTSAMYGAFNLFPPGSNKSFVLTDLFDPSGNSITVKSIRANITNITTIDSQSWTRIKDFVYKTNTISPPVLLRDEGQANYLSTSSQIIGLSLFSISSLISIASIIWIAINRNHPVLRAAQPHFLYPICVGSLFQASCIPFLSFDESQGISTDTLTSFCMAVPWCFSIGTTMTYCALFGKLWTVNKVLQFARVKIESWKIVVPMFVMFLASFIVLSVWSATVNYGWNRTVINTLSGESYGNCGNLDGENHWWWFVAIVLTAGFPVIMALFMAWKTKDVEDSFSESGWIFALVFVQFESLIVGIPLVYILKTVSTDGRYLGMVLLLTTFSMSSTVVIMLPKVLAFYEIYGGKTALRGTRVGTKVTGLSTSDNTCSAGSSGLVGTISGASVGIRRSDLEIVQE